MKKHILLAIVAMAVSAVVVSDVFARGGGRGGGGGGRGGGGFSGGSRGGGGFSGGARPSGGASFDRSPSMSRVAPAQRPAAPDVGSHPAGGAGQGFAGNRPSQLPAGRPSGGTAQAGRPSGQSQQAFQRPSAGDVSNFLNMPADSGRGQLASNAPPRPSQLPANANRFGQTATGPGGGQVTVGGVGGSRTGPGGATVGAGRVGVKVTGPGGNTYTKVAGGAAVRGPGGNVVAAGRGASFVNGQFVGGKSWSAVNGNFTRWNCFTPGWYGRYPGAWWPGKWAIAGTAWATASWALAGGYCGCTGEGTYYDYGENVTYDDGTVYYGDQPMASAEQYYDEAAEIAASGESTDNDEWLPLGVFAVISDANQTDSDRVLQLAVNKDGVVRGNLQDSITEQVIPVVGAVDKQTQRVALQLEGNDQVVAETGLYNLTNDEVPVLLHFGPDRQESRTLIRLKPPETQPSESS